MTHTIVAVHFRHGQPGEDAPLTCSCGWAGIVKGWLEHRRSVGAGDPRSHGVRVPFRVKG